MKIIVFDIGGTDIKYGIYENGQLLNGSFPVRGGETDPSLPERIAGFVREHKPDKVAVCAPGPFDFKNGIIHFEKTDISKSAEIKIQR